MNASSPFSSFSPTDFYARARAWLIALAGGSTEAELVLDVVVLVLLVVFSCLALRKSAHAAASISAACSDFVHNTAMGIMKLALYAFLTYMLVVQTQAAYARLRGTGAMEAPLSAARRIVNEHVAPSEASKQAIAGNVSSWLARVWPW